MDNTGWIKFYRKIEDSIVFENPKLLKVWIWCLFKAAYTDKKVVIGKQIVDIMPGQFVFGRVKAAEALKMSDRTVYDYIKLLEKLGMISVKSNNKYSVITIEKWGLYQEDNTEIQQQTTSQTTQQATQQTTHKEEYIKNNKKNNKKHIYGANQKVRLTDDEKDRLVTELGEDLFNACVDKLDNYKAMTGRTYKSDNLAIRNWVINAVKQNGAKHKGSSYQSVDEKYDMMARWSEGAE